MKLCNFLCLDPNYHGSGLDAGSKLDKVVWDEFWPDKVRLQRTATALMTVATVPPEELPETDMEAPEGRLLLRAHLGRERSEKLRRGRIKQALVGGGRLACEVRDVVLEERYGEVAQGFIECHHVVPLSSISGITKTRLADLALVCPYCHRVLHRGGDALSVTTLRQRLSPAQEGGFVVGFVIEFGTDGWIPVDKWLVCAVPTWNRCGPVDPLYQRYRARQVRF